MVLWCIVVGTYDTRGTTLSWCKFFWYNCLLTTRKKAAATWILSWSTVSKQFAKACANADDSGTIVIETVGGKRGLGFSSFYVISKLNSCFVWMAGMKSCWSAGIRNLRCVQHFLNLFQKYQQSSPLLLGNTTFMSMLLMSMWSALLPILLFYHHRTTQTWMLTHDGYV